MVNYSLIIEYHQKGNNNTQVAPPPKQTSVPPRVPSFIREIAARRLPPPKQALFMTAPLCVGSARKKLPGGSFRAVSARRLPAIKNDQVNCVSSGRETINLPFSRTSSEEAQT